MSLVSFIIYINWSFRLCCTKDIIYFIIIKCCAMEIIYIIIIRCCVMDIIYFIIIKCCAIDVVIIKCCTMGIIYFIILTCCAMGTFYLIVYWEPQKLFLQGAWSSPETYGSAGYQTYKLLVALRVGACLLARLCFCFAALLTESDIKKRRIYWKHVAPNYELKCGAARSVHVP